MWAVEQHTGGCRWLRRIATGFSSAERGSQAEYDPDDDDDDKQEQHRAEEHHLLEFLSALLAVLATDLGGPSAMEASEFGIVTFEGGNRIHTGTQAEQRTSAADHHDSQNGPDHDLPGQRIRCCGSTVADDRDENHLTAW